MKAILIHSYLLKTHIYLLVNLYRLIRLSNVSYTGTPNPWVVTGQHHLFPVWFSWTMTHTSLGFIGEQEMMTSVGKQTWLHESHNRASNCLILKGVLQRSLQEEVLFFLQSALRNTKCVPNLPPHSHQSQLLGREKAWKSKKNKWLPAAHFGNMYFPPHLPRQRISSGRSKEEPPPEATTREKCSVKSLKWTFRYIPGHKLPAVRRCGQSLSIHFFPQQNPGNCLKTEMSNTQTDS